MRLRVALVALLLGLFAVLGIAPLDRTTWMLENSLFVAGLAGLWVTRRWLPLSELSWVLIFVFLVLHEIGAHYTYSLVPYDQVWEALTGQGLGAALGWSRNHYDRFVHLAFGLLLAYPMRELFLRSVGAHGFVSYLLPVQMTMSWSALYELIEWAAALVFGGETGMAYVGTQGDEWDAQKDMCLAGGGALLAMVLTALVHRLRGSDRQRAGLERRLGSPPANVRLAARMEGAP
jgi:putative membrane protein